MAAESAVASERYRRSGLVEALNREWCALVRADRGSTSRWATHHGALFGCRSLDDVVLRAAVESDAVLGALLAEVAAGDEIAARTVLQTMIGRLVRMAQRDYRAGVEDYLSAMWCVIGDYPLSRRPQKISANLSMEALKLVSQERRWMRAAEVSPWPPHAFQDLELDRDHARGARAEPDGTDVLSAGYDLALLDRDTRALLHSVYIDGLSSAEAACQHRSSPTAVRARCSKAVRRLAAHSLALADAA